MTKLVTLAKAQATALIFRRHPLIQRVRIVGNVAVSGTSSHDLDLIFLCDARYVSEFRRYIEHVAMLDAHLSELCPPMRTGDNEKLRAQKIASILGGNFETLLENAQRIVSPALLDLFIEAA